MTPEQIAVLITAIGGPLSGLIIAGIASRRSKRQVAAESQTTERSVRVSERDAHTREIATIIEGYTAVNTATTAALGRAERASSDCSEKYDDLKTRLDEVERVNRERQVELIDHIQALEMLIPSPPGPPERPAWA